jgi:hypothetical protein
MKPQRLIMKSWILQWASLFSPTRMISSAAQPSGTSTIGGSLHSMGSAMKKALTVPELPDWVVRGA